VHHIDRVVDVERHARGRRLVALQPEIDQHIGEPDDGPEVSQVLGPSEFQQWPGHPSRYAAIPRSETRPDGESS
jgi:hypothetical protein